MSRLNNFVRFLKADTWQSWVFCLVGLFIIIKFVFFPLLNFTLGIHGTTALVVIETGSMHHDGGLKNIFKLQSSFNNYWYNAQDWYFAHNITEGEFSKFPFRTGMEIGDIILISKRSQINIGDVIVFDASQNKPIIHRVVSIKEVDGKKIYSTKGDNYQTNPSQLYFETSISEDKVIGKSIAVFPRLGIPKVILARIIGN